MYVLYLTAAWSPDGLCLPGVLAHRGGRPAAHEAAPGEEGEAGSGDLQAGPGRADPLLAVLHTWASHQNGAAVQGLNLHNIQSEYLLRQERVLF